MRARKGATTLAGLLVLALTIGACGGDDDSDGGESAADKPAQEVTLAAAGDAAISEEDLPDGYEKTPTVELEGKEWTFDDVPGHYWKVIDEETGVAVGLHFQNGEDDEFQWAEDVPEGELLYMVYAIPGTCGDGSFEKASKSKDASIVGSLPAGFDHWHAVVDGGSKTGHWLMHTPVRDFTFAGPPDNPMAGTEVKAGDPGFLPVCDIR